MSTRRLLVADYKDPGGRDMNLTLTIWPRRGTADKALAEAVRAELAGAGCKLTCLTELLGDGSTKALYLAPGCLEEVMGEMGLTVPADMPTAMTAAGVHPVNWEELAAVKYERRNER